MFHYVQQLFSKLTFFGGLCILGYSIYRAIQGDFDLLVDYIAPALIPVFIMLVLQLLFPSLLENKFKNLDKVNEKYQIKFKLAYFAENHETLFKNYSYYKERFIFVATIVILVILMVKGVSQV